MLRSRLRRRPGRVRNRIVTRIGLLVAGLALAVGVTTYAVVERALLDEYERSTTEQFTTNAAALTAGLATPGVDEQALLASLRPEVAARDLLLRDDTWTAATTDVRPTDLPDDLVDTVVGGERTMTEVRIDGARYTVHGAPLGEGVYYFEVFPLASVDPTLDTLRRTLVVVGGLAVVTGMALAAWIGRGVARPLERISAAAADLADGDLRARIDERGEAEIVQIATAFNRMADSLQERIEREVRFAADVSHELRSPLTTLANSVSVLESRRHELSDAAAEALSLLVGDMARFQRMVTDLIEISKHDSGTAGTYLEDVPVGTAVRAAVRRSGDEVPVEVAGDPDVDVRIDVRRFDRALANVLENAAAYGRGATLILVETPPGTARITIDDAGPGLAPDEHQRVFERFARGSHGERRTTADGSGLGLALARENLALMGGSIVPADAPGGGARFVIEVPRPT